MLSKLENYNNKYIINLFLYLILPLYLLAGGYYLFSFKYIFPIYMLIVFYLIIKTLNNQFNLEINKLLNKRNLFFIIIFLQSGLYIFRAINHRSIYEFQNIFIGLIIIFLMQYFLDLNRILTLNTIIKIVILILSINFFISFFVFGNYNTPYANRNALTTLFVILTPILFAEVVTKKNLTINISLLSAIGYITILANSRINLIAFFVQFVLTILFILKNSVLKYKKVVILSFIIIILIVSPLAIHHIVRSSRGNIIEQFHNENSSLSIRLHFIKEGFQIFLDNPIFGVGSGNINVPRYTYETDQTINNLHNLVIDILAKYGVITFSIFVYISYTLIKDYFVLKIPPDNPFYHFRVALIIFLMSFPILSNTVSTIFHMRAFYFIFGYFILVIAKLKNNSLFEKEYIYEQN